MHLVRAHKYADGRIGVEMHNLPQPIAAGRSSRAHVRTRKAATYRMRREGTSPPNAQTRSTIAAAMQSAPVK